ncbi:MAG: hypothetical protein HQL14_06970 [Candidatus Omnitrophica bacterium]|nr:hypothetical protein [Candidatus Omnitrophota bacterium]
MPDMLSQIEKDRLIKGLTSVFAVPFIDDIEDFIWEAVFAYVKSIPIAKFRNKKLFDVIDPIQKNGWSVKALQWRVHPGVEFELVVQRADIIKKAKELGFSRLSLKSPEKDLGAALLKHWHKKIEEDVVSQNVINKKICVLLKSEHRDKFAFYEDDVLIYQPNDLSWKWTDKSKTGLQGLRKSDGFCIYRWYPNQKQFFERFVLPQNAFIFELNLKKITIEEIIDLLETHLNSIP